MRLTIKSEGLGWRILRNVVLVLGIIIILGPLYLVLVNSFKTMPEAGRNFFALPQSLNFNNYAELLSKGEYWGYVWNTTYITFFAILLVVLINPTVSYAIARNSHKTYYKLIYFYLLLGLFVPFQVIMLPLTKIMTGIHLLNPFGLIILYGALSLTRGVFLLVNYIQQMPAEIEEAARIDGCSTFQIYYSIILRLIAPMLVTLVIMDALWFWNDFMLPLLLLNKAKEFWTLPLFQYNFKTEYSFNYTMAFTSYLMAMLPIILVYAFGQKHIIAGLTEGAVKG
ncbi:carbohydrate ABC transporter permease [Paenibacillus radicis (ex Gao et al. 2016)]|uniref:Sugar ABC transporter permease n=1 Tax=Paenibacillus radicis (ex Gao et al. 2016) TaxID=1737354 RepID=A0A917H1X5_9BACL|nr:carbohydrate ABC transporter permease [Paenibacillus radicis (ex Gao et al. 2016)]GGG64221.1 sugar ABC transporter permease [Paenibacillus radicis (ex Gao et al. 2016)]